MRLLFDTDVIVDVLAERRPFLAASAPLFSLVEAGRIHGILSSSSVPTVYYLLAKLTSRTKARQTISILFENFRFAPVQFDVLHHALKGQFADFEDGVIHEAALSEGADAIITRNVKDFGQSVLPIFDPVALQRSITDF